MTKEIETEISYIIDFVQSWKPSCTLEVGCNFGRELKTIEYLTQVYGVDKNPEKIDEAKKYIPSGIFSVADGEVLPFPDNFFDLVYSSGGVLCHNPPEKVFSIIREMIRVSRKRIVLLEYLGTRTTPDPDLYLNCKKETWIHDYDNLFIGKNCEVLVSKFVVVGYDKFQLILISKTNLSINEDVNINLDKFEELKEDFSKKIELLKEIVDVLVEIINREKSYIINVEPKIDEIIKLLNNNVLSEISSSTKEIALLKNEIEKIKEKENIIPIPEVRVGKWDRFKIWLEGVNKFMFKKEVK